MKPDQRPRSGNRLGRLARPLTRLLDGTAPADPFYVTNRTVGQRLRLAALIAAPGLVVATALGLEALNYLNPPSPLLPANPLTQEQLASRPVTSVEREIRVDSSRSIEISEVRVDPGPVTMVRGRVLNSSDRVIHDAELIFELTNAAGSRLGAVSAIVPTVRPRSSTPFAFPVRPRDAAFALLREVHAH